MSVVIQLIAAFFGCISFAIMFRANRKYWLLIAVSGTLSWALFLLCCTVFDSFFSNIITAVFCSLFAHIAAKIVKAPTTCLLMPSSVPMIPGGYLYYTMYYALGGDLERCKAYLMLTVKTIFAIAVGFALVSLIFRMREKTVTNQRKEQI